MATGEQRPRADWRRRFGLVLGLERMLADPQPHLLSGLALRPHQVDALAGMLAALMADAERGDDDEDDAAPDDEGAEAEEVEPETEDDEDDDESEVAVDVVPDDPGARRRYRFKHPTASGKTVAAAGFVDSCRSVGVLILTHRRLLVDQFTRDLTEHGYGPRIVPAIDKGRRVPTLPPVTIETYAWFIRHAATIEPTAYGVVICDEAHTALGERTAATIRKFNLPVYIGMTATDQLLQKHVGDVFPAEIADFPLGDAVRRGVVAPLRALRVQPGASLRNVPVVGGDYDQKVLAQALDHDALNMAAAMYYADRFGDRPGIIYAAGVDHAERVASALRAVGVKARAVSGRTPPRQLAETLAGYERGETNVLVNAQLLAEGWNAPRATICMQLAPTASKRVYQQRVGRIMRLHRRKEAGVVVDFADPGAPHSDRTVTLHSLLDADIYRPGALVTPKPPRRRQRWRRQARPVVREADWLLPVADDPLRRRAVITTEWKTVAADRLPQDEQLVWAEVAARRLAPTDSQKLFETLLKMSEPARIHFLATAAAESKHRSLRLTALGDLASRRPDANTFDRVVRLVEAAPTWAADRQAGARVLLLALASGTLPGSASQKRSWAWRLGRASRDAQLRAAADGIPGIRDRLRGLGGPRGEGSNARHRAALEIVRDAHTAPRGAAAAVLAVATSQDPIASRALDKGRDELTGEPEELAEALGLNIPAPREREKPQKKRRRKPKPGARQRMPGGEAPEPVDADTGGDAEAEVAEGEEGTERANGDADAPPPETSEPLSRAKRRRRRRRRRAAALADPVTGESPEPHLHLVKADPGGPAPSDAAAAAE